MQNYFHKSPIGLIKFQIEDGALVSLNFAKEQGEVSKDCVFSNLVKSQLDEYFSAKRKKFDIKINPKGTDFQKSVWKELLKVPYGETKTYGEIAQKLGNKNLSHPIGFACGKNPILIIIPCHRIISKNGGLTGYCAGIDKKKFLLNLENSLNSHNIKH